MATKSLIKHGNDSALARNNWTAEQIALIKNTIAVGATDDELKLFLYVAQKSGLDPLARQIYFVKRMVNVKQPNGAWVKEGRMTIQTGIDGFRVVAERSGKYAGQTKAEFEEKDGEIISCTVGVYRKNAKYPIYATAYFDEYAQKIKTPQGEQLAVMWAKMKHTMIAKCAEALALRKSFPQDLSGIYTAEEMQQADVQEKVTNEKAVKVTPSTPQDTAGIIRRKIEQSQSGEELHDLAEKIEHWTELDAKVREQLALSARTKGNNLLDQKITA